MNYSCPVCFFDNMPYPPERYNICPCCGTEFDNDDVECSYEELRYNWVVNGARWFYGQSPANWNPWVQLASASYGVRPVAPKTCSSNTATIRAAAGLELQLV